MSQASRTSYRISNDPADLARERRRLEHLSTVHDGATIRRLEKLGVAEGWRCLEVGAGAGTISRWLGLRVGANGQVLSVDVDTRFHVAPPPGVEVRELDVTKDPLPARAFDLVHARALLEHLEQRESVLDQLVAALAPGGWILLEDADWMTWEHQPLPEPFGRIARASLAHSEQEHGMSLTTGRWLLPALLARGLRDCNARGHVYAMRGSTPSAEWFVQGLERAGPPLVAGEAAPAPEFERALAQAREPAFTVLSPLGVQAWGRRPG